MHSENFPVLVTVALAPDLIALDIDWEIAGGGHGGWGAGAVILSSPVLPRTWGFASVVQFLDRALYWMNTQ